MGPPNKSPLNRQQLPLVKSEMDTSRSRPRLSANNPPHTDPMPPIAIVVNASNEINRGARILSPAATLAARNEGIQVQNA